MSLSSGGHSGAGHIYGGAATSSNLDSLTSPSALAARIPARRNSYRRSNTSLGLPSVAAGAAIAPERHATMMAPAPTSYAPPPAGVADYGGGLHRSASYLVNGSGSYASPPSVAAPPSKWSYQPPPAPPPPLPAPGSIHEQVGYLAKSNRKIHFGFEMFVVKGDCPLSPESEILLPDKPQQAGVLWPKRGLPVLPVRPAGTGGIFAHIYGCHIEASGNWGAAQHIPK